MAIKFEFNLELFKADRKNLGLSAEEISEKSGLSVNIIRNIDAGRKKEFNPYEIKQMCDAIGLDVKKYVKKIPPKKIAVLTNKGGAGKTSSCVNIAASMAKFYGKKTLIIDADLQQNTTIHLGIYKQGFVDEYEDENEMFPEAIIDNEEFTITFPVTNKYYDNIKTEDEELDELEYLSIDEFYNPQEIETKNFYTAFRETQDITNHIIKSKWENLDMVISCDAMARIDTDIFSMKRSDLQTRKIMRKINDDWETDYDFVFFDCNPSLGKLNESILVACDYLLVPVACAPLDKRGLFYVFDFVEEIRTDYPEVNILGVLLTKVASRERMTKKIARQIKQNKRIGKYLFEHYIPYDIKHKEAQDAGEPLYQSFPNGRSTIAYKYVCKEILERLENAE